MSQLKQNLAGMSNIESWRAKQSDYFPLCPPLSFPILMIALLGAASDRPHILLSSYLQA